MARVGKAAGRLAVIAAALGALGAAAAPASAQELKMKTVDAEVVFEHGNRPGDPGNCSAVVFVMWPAQEGERAATAHYFWKDSESTKSGEPPYDDTYERVATYHVPAGHHWIQVGAGWGDGPVANDCSDMSARQREFFGTEATVDVMVEVPKGGTPACRAAEKLVAKRRHALSQLQARLREASGAKAAKLQRKAAKAEAKRAKALARAERLC